MRKEQLLLLALLAALFRPASGQSHFKADEIDDDCHVKTSIVLHKLKSCVKEKTKDDFKRNQLWTDVVKETTGEMIKQLRAETKSQSDQLTNLQEKLEIVMKQVNEDKIEMKALMDRILQSVEGNKKQMGRKDLMKQDQTIIDCRKITLATWPLLMERNMTMFFKAMGRTFYYNTTHDLKRYESRDWCSSRGMHLATLKTADELEQVKNTLRAKLSSTSLYALWVSASDIGRSPGQFHWADGTPVLKSTWRSGEPNDVKANQETCALIHTGLEKLWDRPCSYHAYTLCEVPELLATCL